jgi:hypothetical protein
MKTLFVSHTDVVMDLITHILMQLFISTIPKNTTYLGDFASRDHKLFATKLTCLVSHYPTCGY